MAEQDRVRLGMVVATLMQGPIYAEEDERIWHDLLELRAQVADYVAVIGLRAVVDEAEGFAFLQSLPDDDEPFELPRLVKRRKLTLPVSILLVLLREQLAEADAHGAEGRLVLSREQIVELMRTFSPTAASDARLVDKIAEHIGAAVKLGFLRPLADGAEYEVRRILKAYLTGEWLAGLDRQLAEYAAELTGDADDGAGGDSTGGDSAGGDSTADDGAGLAQAGALAGGAGIYLGGKVGMGNTVGMGETVGAGESEARP